MLDGLLNGVFALDFAQTMRINKVPLLELMRTPFAINLGILGGVVVWLCRAGNVRAGLTAFSLGCLLVMTGLVFTAILLTACVVVFLLARLLHRWALRRGAPGVPLLAGWGVVNALYSPLFFITMPAFEGYMTVGELVLFWGPAFMVFRSLHYIHLACKSRVDPFERGAFGKFLHFIVHFASFWFGPYQKFKQFTSEVDSCKERQTLRNQARGWLRILIGVAKFLVVFHLFNLDHFYPNGYFGPFADALFANAHSADPGHLWLMLYLFMLRILIFISAISDGVIGMNLLMGIRVPENSNWPLFSRDILEFWRRWHIQAGVFLREEVFFPIGGLRKAQLGFFCVFAYSGFWHFPSLSAAVAFPVLQLVLIELTMRWIAFWKEREARGGRIDALGKRFLLHDSWLSGLVGMVFVFHTNVFSVVFIHDHFFGGGRILPRMFGF